VIAGELALPVDLERNHTPPIRGRARADQLALCCAAVRTESGAIGGEGEPLIATRPNKRRGGELISESQRSGLGRHRKSLRRREGEKESSGSPHCLELCILRDAARAAGIKEA
jgi:hypothetical protein